MSTYLVQGQELTKPQARALAADLLTFAGPERDEAFTATASCGETVRFSRAATSHALLVATNGKPLLRPPQIDALIVWLQGHREDFPG